MGASRVVAKTTNVAANNVARVTALETKSNDVQDLMDVKMYEFDVRVPSGAKSSRQFLVLEKKRRGQAAENWLRVPLSTISNAKRMRISIGLYPPDGDMMHSKKVKYRIHTRNYNSAGKLSPGFTVSQVTSNPFDEMKATYPSSSIAVPQKDGSFMLFGGSKGSGWGAATDDFINNRVSASSFDTALVFAIR
jgi:hypothetical protein